MTAGMWRHPEELARTLHRPDHVRTPDQNCPVMYTRAVGCVCKCLGEMSEDFAKWE